MLTDEQLIKLDTKRLLALKKTVLAKKSALYSRNTGKLDGITHPFELSLNMILKDKEDYNELCNYHFDIIEILETRENVK
jgi:hypothetical protein